MQFCRNVLLETKLNMRVCKNLKLNLAMTYFMKPEGGGKGGGPCLLDVAAWVR